jgi:transcription initiation factor TFIIB
MSKDMKISERTYNFMKDSIEELFPENVENAEEECTKLLRKVYEERAYHGRKMEEVVGGVIYLSSRKFSIVNPSRVAEVVNADENNILTTTRHIMKTVDLDMSPTTSPSNYISKYSDKLELEDDLEKEALRICEKTKKNNLSSGKSPSGFAASSIYTASRRNGGDITQRELSEISGVSEVTIRKNYKKQMDSLKKE